MNARQHASKIGHQTSRALAIAALTLGLATTALAPNAAFAASLNASAQDASVQGIFGNREPADLTAGIGHPDRFTAGQRDLVPVVIENHGASTDRDISVTFMVSPGFTDVTWRFPSGQVWECDQPDVSKLSGIASVTCETEGLEAGGFKAILVTATAREDGVGDLWMVAKVDPKDHIKELDETNNIGKRSFGSSEVLAPQFLLPDRFIDD